MPAEEQDQLLRRTEEAGAAQQPPAVLGVVPLTQYAASWRYKMGILLTLLLVSMLSMIVPMLLNYRYRLETAGCSEPDFLELCEKLSCKGVSLADLSGFISLVGMTEDTQHLLLLKKQCDTYCSFFQGMRDLNENNLPSLAEGSNAIHARCQSETGLFVLIFAMALTACVSLYLLWMWMRRADALEVISPLREEAAGHPINDLGYNASIQQSDAVPVPGPQLQLSVAQRLSGWFSFPGTSGVTLGYDAPENTSPRPV